MAKEFLKSDEIHIIPTKTENEIITFYGKGVAPETKELISKEVSVMIEKIREYIPKGVIFIQYAPYPVNLQIYLG